MENKLKRQSGLDVLKFLCAFLIVCIHIPFGFKGNDYFTVLTRFAVPTFFMISGFFYPATIERGKQAKQILKTVKLAVTSFAVYFVWRIVYTLITKGDVLAVLKKGFSLEEILSLIFFNKTYFGGHLWYLNALIYTLLVMYVFARYKKFNWLYCISPILILCDLVFGTYAVVLFGKTFTYYIFRNFLFIGIPFFTLGYFISENKQKITTFFRKKFKRPDLILGINSILLAAMSVAEYSILKANFLLASRENYIFSVLLTINTFLLFSLFYKDNNSTSEKFTATIGNRYSGDVYIYHSIIINVCSLVFSAIGIYKYYSFIAPIFVYALTIFLVFLFSKLKEKSVPSK